MIPDTIFRKKDIFNCKTHQEGDVFVHDFYYKEELIFSYSVNINRDFNKEKIVLPETIPFNIGKNLGIKNMTMELKLDKTEFDLASEANAYILNRLDDNVYATN